MITLRRGLRLWATAWLVFQVATLSALVPRDCCFVHRPAAAEESCHKPAPVKCAMRATCDGPMAALLTMLSNLGIPPAAIGVVPDLPSSQTTVTTRENLISDSTPPDPPPPRA